MALSSCTGAVCFLDLNIDFYIFSRQIFSCYFLPSNLAFPELLDPDSWQLNFLICVISRDGQRALKVFTESWITLPNIMGQKIKKALLHPKLLAWCWQTDLISSVLMLISNQTNCMFIQFTCPHFSTVAFVAETSFLPQYPCFSSSLATEPCIWLHWSQPLLQLDMAMGLCSGQGV